MTAPLPEFVYAWAEDTSEEFPSPCVNVCKLDPDTGLCEGCHRNRDEIRTWSRGTNADRVRILETLVDRRRRSTNPETAP